LIDFAKQNQSKRRAKKYALAVQTTKGLMRQPHTFRTAPTYGGISIHRPQKTFRCRRWQKVTPCPLQI